MITKVDFPIAELRSMKKYPQELLYIGNINILKKQKISIVGSRKPNQYASQLTHEIVSKLIQNEVCIVSGGAIGIDTIAHKSAGAKNTIMVAGTGLDKRYPAINKNLIIDIETNGLVLSQFSQGTPSRKYNFPLRNELIVALGEILLVMYADENSGTMRSVQYAQKMGKKIYVLAHRIGESTASNRLLQTGVAEAIYNVDDFIKSILPQSVKPRIKRDNFLEFCATNPTYDRTVENFPSRVFEAELIGEIEVKNGIVYLKK